MTASLPSEPIEFRAASSIESGAAPFPDPSVAPGKRPANRMNPADAEGSEEITSSFASVGSR